MNIAIIGLGLIGGNIAIDVHRKFPKSRVLAFDTDSKSLDFAESNQIIDQGFNKLEQMLQCLQTKDLLIVAVPPRVVLKYLEIIDTFVARGFTTTDVASFKGEVVKGASLLSSEFQKSFIPGHPIAGSEKNGVQNSRSKVFNKQKVVLTPLEGHLDFHYDKVKFFWQTLGAEVIVMDASLHDKIFALTSHLPHILAFNLLNLLLKQSQNTPCLLDFPAGGFRDFTRIGGSNPTMWSQICVANAKLVNVAIDHFIQSLMDIKTMSTSGDTEALEHFFDSAKDMKNKLK